MIKSLKLANDIKIVEFIINYLIILSKANKIEINIKLIDYD